MPNTNHVDITDPNVHEPKGAASAAADSFYVADGSGSGSWKKRLLKLTAAITPVPTGTFTTTSHTVTGVAATDILIGVQTSGGGLVTGYVTGANTVSLTYGATLNGSEQWDGPAAGTWTFFFWRP
jgi:hypothetical protein